MQSLIARRGVVSTQTACPSRSPNAPKVRSCAPLKSILNKDVSSTSDKDKRPLGGGYVSQTEEVKSPGLAEKTMPKGTADVGGNPEKSYESGQAQVKKNRLDMAQDADSSTNAIDVAKEKLQEFLNPKSD